MHHSKWNKIFNQAESCKILIQGVAIKWNFHQDLTRFSLVEDLVLSRLNPVWILITIHSGSSTASNENHVLILTWKRFLGIVLKRYWTYKRGFNAN
jgi:hypothetical protein